MGRVALTEKKRILESILIEWIQYRRLRRFVPDIRCVVAYVSFTFCVVQAEPQELTPGSGNDATSVIAWEDASGDGLATAKFNDLLPQSGYVKDISDSSPWIQDFLNHRSPIQIGVTLEAYHDDNPFLIRPGQEEEDFTWELLPRITYESSRPEAGKQHFLALGYDPEILRYQTFHILDAFNHRGFGEYRFKSAKVESVIAHRSAEFSESSGEFEDALIDEASADLGRRRRGDRHISTLATDFQVSKKSRLEVKALRLARNFDLPTIADSEEWEGAGFLMHSVAPKTELGMGVRIGQVAIDRAPDQLYEAVLGRAVWQVSPKLSFDLAAGVDFRRFEGPLAAGNRDTPIFEAGLIWHPLKQTQVSLKGFRDVRYSVTGHSVIRTGIRAGFRQRLGDRANYSFGGMINSRDYQPTTISGLVGREDEFLSLIHRIDYKLGDRGEIGVFHEYRRDESNTVFGFERGLTGVRASYGF